MKKEYYELLKQKVTDGNYIKEDMVALIEKRRVEGKITEEARDTLLKLVEECHNSNYEEEITQATINKVLYEKVDNLEMAVMDLAEMISYFIENGGAV